MENGYDEKQLQLKLQAVRSCGWPSSKSTTTVKLISVLPIYDKFHIWEDGFQPNGVILGHILFCLDLSSEEKRPEV